MKATNKIDAIIGLVEQREDPTRIRSQLIYLREQIEAYDKAEVSRAALHDANQKQVAGFQAEIVRLKAEVARLNPPDWLEQAAKRHREFLRRRELNYDV